MSTIETITEPASPSSPAGAASPSKLSQLEQLLKQGKVHLQDLRTRLQEATDERDRLAAQLKERDTSQEALWAEQAELQRADSERHERELTELRAKLQEAMAARDEAVAARNRMSDEMREMESQRTSLEKGLAAAIDEVDELRSDAERAAALAREIFEIHHK